MKRFEAVLNDTVIIERYEQIDVFENLTGGSAHHNLEHAKNVAVLVAQLMEQLGYEKDLIEEARIAAILHDTGALEGRKDHAIRSYNFAENYFKEHNINLKYKDMVLEAIKIHSTGFESDNIIALAVILSDKLDI